ncbi:hypothetical protein D3C86_1426340 [compost metagenome]
MVGQVQARFGHRRQGAQVFLDQPAAGGATDAFHQQRGFGHFAFVADKGLLHIGAVVKRQFVDQLYRQRLGVGRGFAAVLVIAIQAAGDDGLGHGLATRAAELAGLPQDRSGEAAAGRDGQGAVVAGEWGGGHGVFTSTAESLSSDRASSRASSLPQGSWVYSGSEHGADQLWERACSRSAKRRLFYFFRSSAPCSGSSPSSRSLSWPTSSSSNMRQMCSS